MKKQNLNVISLMKRGETGFLFLFSSLTFGARDLKPSRGDGSWSNLKHGGVSDQV